MAEHRTLESYVPKELKVDFNNLPLTAEHLDMMARWVDQFVVQGRLNTFQQLEDNHGNKIGDNKNPFGAFEVANVLKERLTKARSEVTAEVNTIKQHLNALAEALRKIDANYKGAEKNNKKKQEAIEKLISAAFKTGQPDGPQQPPRPTGQQPQ